MTLLPFFSTVKRNRFGVVAHVHETVPQIGLFAELLKIEINQLLAEKKGYSCADCGIDQKDKDELYRDAPQDADKGDKPNNGKKYD